MRCCLLHVCLLVRCFPVTGPSLVRLLVCLLVRLSLVCCWSVTGLSLVCCWSVAGLLGSWPLVMVADRASLVHRSCVTRLPVPLSAGLLLVRRWPWPLLCLLLSRCSACLSVCWPVAFLSLVCLLVRRCSSVADVSLVCLLVHHWLSLSCTCSGSPVHRSSICSCIARASVTRLSLVCHSSVARASVTRLSLVHLLVHRSCVCHSSVTRASARASARPSARASVTRPSARVRFACRWSVTPLSHESVCSFVVGLFPRPSARVVVAAPWFATRLSPIRRWSWPLVHLLVRRALLCPLLSCLLFCHQSVCCSVTSLSARVMVAGSSFVHLLPVAGPSTGVVVTGLSLVCLLARRSCV